MHLEPAIVFPSGRELDERKQRFVLVEDAVGREMQNAAAYLELHIEQGPVLEGGPERLGVVTGIWTT